MPSGGRAGVCVTDSNGAAVGHLPVRRGLRPRTPVPPPTHHPTRQTESDRPARLRRPESNRPTPLGRPKGERLDRLGSVWGFCGILGAMLTQATFLFTYGNRPTGCHGRAA
ncbi:hypothetical protein GCM10011578_057160 [Streptomyces fuscichromogenes]|uniref:Uncharacterized protein n=1 Tax=Streptomyces fuscichromogenes TaxID=1324013 RepID=A0A917XGZ9_9ACTN|nr:hypothetical protein GCM10011578_057160 [Streptomyces fuscichromogenes]